MESHPCFKVFMEIGYHNTRLSELGNEAFKVLEMMRKEGMPQDVHDSLFEIAVKAARLETTSITDKDVKENKRCKWWNKGFCREKGDCSYIHLKKDCQHHLNGDCTNKGCNTFRQRKLCTYIKTYEGCHRRNSCDYLHKKVEWSGVECFCTGKCEEN